VSVQNPLSSQSMIGSKSNIKEDRMITKTGQLDETELERNWHSLG